MICLLWLEMTNLKEEKSMDKINVIYWSQTGNTKEMAKAIAKGIESAGKEVAVL